jgi:glyoxylase-like metal-dependent hydrolase (beta-lactamase superfamily II)
MEIYNVQGLQHAQGMLMAYMPKERIVVEADLFTPPAQGATLPTMVAPSARTFYNNVQRLKLDVQTIAPIHGGARIRGRISRSTSAQRRRIRKSQNQIPKPESEPYRPQRLRDTENKISSESLWLCGS